MKSFFILLTTLILHTSVKANILCVNIFSEKKPIEFNLSDSDYKQTFSDIVIKAQNLQGNNSLFGKGFDLLVVPPILKKSMLKGYIGLIGSRYRRALNIHINTYTGNNEDVNTISNFIMQTLIRKDFTSFLKQIGANRVRLITTYPMLESNLKVTFIELIPLVDTKLPPPNNEVIQIIGRDSSTTSTWQFTVPYPNTVSQASFLLGHYNAQLKLAAMKLNKLMKFKISSVMPIGSYETAKYLLIYSGYIFAIAYPDQYHYVYHQETKYNLFAQKAISALKKLHDLKLVYLSNNVAGVGEYGAVVSSDELTNIAMKTFAFSMEKIRMDGLLVPVSFVVIFKKLHSLGYQYNTYDNVWNNGSSLP